MREAAQSALATNLFKINRSQCLPVIKIGGERIHRLVFIMKIGGEPIRRRYEIVLSTFAEDQRRLQENRFTDAVLSCL